MRVRNRRRDRRGAAALAGVAAVAALATGCGIRPTVPVDAGAAPSRMPCSLSDDEVVTRAPQVPQVPVRVYLVCASGLEAVNRSAPAPGDKGRAGRVEVAQELLDQLGAELSQTEREAGFTTYVQGPLTVAAAREGDPADTLRLSRQPEDLPPAALSQIVCTYAENSTTASAGTAVLGGPGPYAARAYRCTGDIKERPESGAPTQAP
ncbi:hypothetical protein [Streptomyces sp. SP18CS02]|uniref:hypothetical protein n=1 Tax=Streptomyces sp. SP18CS02 TaxID=3002531 RepID=UPI002E770E46|nr:hypothetical protein [Streptomyces sp. SP18CS02]MEE1756208.1 hypothetical protein [Streptomyces sp. SP18CS02]